MKCAPLIFVRKTSGSLDGCTVAACTGKVVDFYKAMCAPLEGGSGRGLTQLLEVVQNIWRCEKVEERWPVGKLRLLPKSGDLSNPNNWRGITLLAVIAKLFCSVLSNRMTSHMQVTGLEAQCGFMPGKSTIDAIFTMRVSLQKRFRFQRDSLVLFVDFVRAFDTVPRGDALQGACSTRIQSEAVWRPKFSG